MSSIDKYKVILRDGIGNSGLDDETTLVMSAIRKQVPVPPFIKYGPEVHTHRLGRFLEFHCPSCNKHIVAMYEHDRERGGGISTRLRGCSTCLQAIDFGEWYHRDEDDEIEFEE